MRSTIRLPEKIRVSVGSAIVLGLLEGKIGAAPTTAYMLTYREGKCLANCGFCPQARASKSRADMLARVTWPAFSTKLVIEKISLCAEKSDVKRVCVQALNYPTVFDDLLNLTEVIHSCSKVPISLSCQPLSKSQMKQLQEAGAGRISIALDAATKQLFDEVKGSATLSPYTWHRQHAALTEAVEVFGKDHVYTHLIVGLGETEKEITQTIQWCIDSGISPSLFAFTSIPGTALEDTPQPSIQVYRRVQLARYLIVHGKTRIDKMRFNDRQKIVDFGVRRTELKEVIEGGLPFYTSGCPECNRPYYNERPGGPMYNFPRRLVQGELEEVEKELNI